MTMFIPKRVIFEKDVLNYELARNILNMLKNVDNTEIIHLNSNRYKEYIPGDDLPTQYKEGKRTLIVGIKKSLKFQTCKPSAHYQLPLVSGCVGQCEYCYLNTQLGDKPFIRVYVNFEDILNQTDKYLNERASEITIFEGSATSDPIPVEPYTHSLAKTIEYFGQKENGRFRFVTKYSDIEALLNIKHQGHTEIRFSLNTDSVIHQYEHHAASRDKRIEASRKALEAGYPVGYLIAPVFIYPDWKEEYHQLLLVLKKSLNSGFDKPIIVKKPITFEIISHRYTTIAKNRILEIFPESKLPMKDEERKYKFGQFGYGKYVYPKESLDEIKDFFKKEINDLFSSNEIKYII